MKSFLTALKPWLFLNLLLAGALGAQSPALRMEWAVENNDAAQVARLTRQDPQLIDAPLPSGSVPLVLAASKGHWETVRLLLDRAADITVKDSTGTNAFLAASGSRSPGLAAWLAQRGAPVQVSDASGNTLLHRLAALPGTNWPWILGLGLDLEARNSLGQTPFLKAVWSGSLAAARTLAFEGARTGDADFQGRTARDYVRLIGDPALAAWVNSLPVQTAP